ncbi:MAG: hypothetical protein HKN92_07670 [Chitinophagales bacterium]|nr:hypothetical protein [Chitinophagales bacterium]
MKGVIHHIEIYVSDLNRSTEFWNWLLTELGYKKFQQWDQGISYKLNESYIVFVQTEDQHLDIPYHRKRTGLNHMAFHVNSREMVDEFTEKLKARNIKILYADKHPYAGGENYYAVFFEDPDRIKVELVSDR